VLCTGNSCRSQMAEGWIRALMGDRIEVHSAGLEPRGLDPRAVRVMAEAGVDISHHRSQRVDEFLGRSFDLVITVCDDAQESCPRFLGPAVRMHYSFQDPPRLARDARTEDEALAHYRRVRDEIRVFVKTLPDSLRKAGD